MTGRAIPVSVPPEPVKCVGNLAPIDLMHNNVKQCFRGSNVHCGSCTDESNMASYFPEEGNLNGRNTDMCSDVAGPSSSGSGDLFELSERSNKADPESLNRADHYWPPSLDFSVTTTPETSFRGVLRHYA